MTRRVPVEGKSSVCLICINNYRIIILITGVLSLSAWVKYFLSFIANTSHACAHTCAHTCTHVHTRAHTAVVASPPYTLSLFGGAQPTVTARSACDNAGRWPFKSTQELAIYPRFWKFFAYKKIARPNRDANLLQDVLSDDTNS